MTEALVKGDPAFIKTLEVHHDFVGDYLNKTILEELYRKIIGEPDFDNILKVFPHTAKFPEVNNPDEIRLSDIQRILATLVGRFDSELYKVRFFINYTENHRNKKPSRLFLATLQHG